jgi:hypothetical protein
MTSCDCANDDPENTSSRQQNDSEEINRGFIDTSSVACGRVGLISLREGRRVAIAKLKVAQIASALLQIFEAALDRCYTSSRVALEIPLKE